MDDSLVIPKCRLVVLDNQLINQFYPKAITFLKAIGFIVGNELLI